MRLSGIFSSHMVLQRDLPVSVHGESTPNDTITVRFASQSVTAKADANGKWIATLEPMRASVDPRDLLITSAADPSPTRLTDVLVGEVFLASGQSNMAWTVQDSNNAEAEVAAANHPLIRLYTVPGRALDKPIRTFEPVWQVCSPEVIRPFSAVGYFFARFLQQNLNVPVGIINSSWGGTRIEAWTSRDALLTHAPSRAEILDHENGPDDPAKRQSWELFAKDPIAWERAQVPADPGNFGFEKGWASPDFSDADWPTMKTPAKWQTHGHNYSGVFWFRKEVHLPASWAGKDLVLRPGACDKHDTSYFNNTQVGQMGWEQISAWNTHRVHKVPGHLVKAGRNVITVRVYSYMTDGGLIGPYDAMRLERADGAEPAIPLHGEWRFKVEHNFGLQPGLQPPMGPGNPNTPHILYDNMIEPLAPLALRGAIWYQGESNATKPDEYSVLFPLMINDWRKTFANPNLAFYFVQLANYKLEQFQPVEVGWAEIREAQLSALKLPHTGMALAIDIGDANDIHPRNKQEVGRRLGLAALATTFNQKIPHSGPLYRYHKIDGDTIRITFDHAAGLKTSDAGPVQGVAISNGDGRWEWAESRIENDTLVARHPGIAKPAAVRYAWADNPKANLTNASNLPTCPFRTDGR